MVGSEKYRYKNFTYEKERQKLIVYNYTHTYTDTQTHIHMYTHHDNKNKKTKTQTKTKTKTQTKTHLRNLCPVVVGVERRHGWNLMRSHPSQTRGWQSPYTHTRGWWQRLNRSCMKTSYVKRWDLTRQRQGSCRLNTGQLDNLGVKHNYSRKITT